MLIHHFGLLAHMLSALIALSVEINALLGIVFLQVIVYNLFDLIIGMSVLRLHIID